MSATRLTEQAERDIEELFTLRHRALEILDIVIAEWNSDPQSVACFDLRIVTEAGRVMRRIKQLDRLF